MSQCRPTYLTCLSNILIKTFHSISAFFFSSIQEGEEIANRVGLRKYKLKKSFIQSSSAPSVQITNEHLKHSAEFSVFKN